MFFFPDDKLGQAPDTMVGTSFDKIFRLLLS
jgi:hypothetical protein